MSDNKMIMYELKDIAEVLVRHNRITSGHWGLAVTFGLGATNLEGVRDGQTVMNPAALIPILSVGIREFDKPSTMTFDASTLADKPKIVAKKATSKKSS